MIDLIATILASLIVILIYPLIYWGIGSLTTTVFMIDYNWTFMHGLVTALIIAAAKSIFNNK